MEQSASSMGMGGFNEKQLTAQNSLIDALNAQVTAEGKINALKQAQDNLATAKNNKTMGGEDYKKLKELAREAKQEADDAERAWDEAYKLAVSKLQESERHKIEATKEGSKERLAAIDAAIKEENAKGLQETGYYKSLLSERVNLTRKMGEEETHVKAELAKEGAAHENQMDLLRLQAREEAGRHALDMQHTTDRQLLAAELAAENDRYETQQEAFAREIAALDKDGKEYEVKLKQLHDREAEGTQQHENRITALKDAAEAARFKKIEAAEQKTKEMFASGMSRTLMQQQSFGSMMTSIGAQ